MLLHFLLNVTVNVFGPLVVCTQYSTLGELSCLPAHNWEKWQQILSSLKRKGTKEKKKKHHKISIARILSESKNTCSEFNQYYNTTMTKEIKAIKKNVTTLLPTCQNTWSAIIKSVWTNHLITLNHRAVIWNQLILTVIHWIMLVLYALTPQSKNETNFQDLGLFLDPIAILAWVVKYLIINLLLIMDSFNQYETVLLPQRMVPNWRNCSGV